MLDVRCLMLYVGDGRLEMGDRMWDVGGMGVGGSG
jgi:hypothetical protein